MKKKYLQFCPWHFKNGKTFNNAQCDDLKINDAALGGQ